MQDGRNVDLNRLKEFCAAYQGASRQDFHADVKNIVLQHSVQTLLQGLRSQPVPFYAQASTKLQTIGRMSLICTTEDQHVSQFATS